VIVDGKQIAQEIIGGLQEERKGLKPIIKLGVLLGQGDAAASSFVRIKERVAERLGVVLVREELLPEAGTRTALRALERLLESVDGVILQLPLPERVEVGELLAALPAQKDVDGLGTGALVRPPVAEAVSEILARAGVAALGKKAVVVGAGRLVGLPVATLLQELGAAVSVVTQERGSLAELAHADIAVLGAGRPHVVRPEMLKPGVVLIDAGTSDAAGQGGALAGDADPACATIASVFTPVPGGVGPIAVAMLFKNLLLLVRRANS
jgi:methylenetetrahydrofolate dehydrogenase (NADP+) / methenyltetrahydrofolate cyclohydrolase